MWYCKLCGTQSPTPTMCTGCGSFMLPCGHTVAPRQEQYQFVLMAHDQHVREFIGPFENVLAADQWWDQHRQQFPENMGYEVVLMEART